MCTEGLCRQLRLFSHVRRIAEHADMAGLEGGKGGGKKRQLVPVIMDLGTAGRTAIREVRYLPPKTSTLASLPH